MLLTSPSTHSEEKLSYSGKELEAAGLPQQECKKCIGNVKELSNPALKRFLSTNVLPPKHKKPRFIDYTLTPFKATKSLLKQELYQPKAFTQKDAAALINKLKEAGLNIEVLESPTSDGFKNFSIFCRSQEALKNNNRTKVYFHGNGGNIASTADEAIKDYKQGFNVCLTSYRGYSSPGQPSEEGLISDTNATLDHLQRLGIAPQVTDLHCFSLGTAVALKTLSKRQSQGRHFNHIPESYNRIKLTAPFTSVRALAKNRLPLLPKFMIKLLIPDYWNSKEAVRKIKANTVEVFHGTEDQVVPFKQGLELREECRKLGIPGTMYELKDSNYSDVLKGKHGCPRQVHFPYDVLNTQAEHKRIELACHEKNRGMRYAISISLPNRAEILAADSGEVIKIEESRIAIASANKRVQIFENLAPGSIKVKEGDRVSARQAIAQACEKPLIFAYGPPDENSNDVFRVRSKVVQFL